MFSIGFQEQATVNHWLNNGILYLVIKNMYPDKTTPSGITQQIGMHIRAVLNIEVFNKSHKKRGEHDEWPNVNKTCWLLLMNLRLWTLMKPDWQKGMWSTRANHTTGLSTCSEWHSGQSFMVLGNSEQSLLVNQMERTSVQRGCEVLTAQCYDCMLGPVKE